jgi:hypothetical protein
MVRYRIYKRPAPISILSQINPVHASPSHFLKIRFSIILPSMPRSFKWLLLWKSGLKLQLFNGDCYSNKYKFYYLENPKFYNFQGIFYNILYVENPVSSISFLSHSTL